MASRTYPRITPTAWATLRSRAVSSPSIKFAPATVATWTNTSSKTALDNVVRPMQQLGLIDQDGALTDLGNKWRVDLSYGDACQIILDTVYTNEMVYLVDSNGHLDQQMVKAWFQQQGFGESNAARMAATYVLVASKRIPEPPGTAAGTKSALRNARRTKEAQLPRDDERPVKRGVAESPDPPDSSTRGPSVHLNIQVHIPADATPEQIDLIFSSMARHLYAP